MNQEGNGLAFEHGHADPALRGVMDVLPPAELKDLFRHNAVQVRAHRPLYNALFLATR
jgi:hypothetical protein